MLNLSKECIRKLNEPSIWIRFSKLANELKAVNLGQGFPDWSPPEFYLESLLRNVTNEKANHQYTRAYGSMNLVNSIIKNHQKYFNFNLTENNVLVTSGGIGGLYNTITSFIDKNDEVIVIEPFYDSYYPISSYSYGRIIGVPLIPPKRREKNEYKALLSSGEYTSKMRISSKIKDNWEFDFKKFEESLSERTKLIIFNSPNNPTGKIYTNEEYKEITQIILKKSPNAIILSDEVYEHIYFDLNKEFPRIANMKGLENRTLTLSSAGKIFSATGVRIGWLIGNEDLIRTVSQIHSQTAFCLYDPIQNLISDCLNEAEKEYKGFANYYDWYRDNYNKSRTHMMYHLINTKNIFQEKEYNLKYYLPEGGYFIVGDISNSIASKDHRIKGEENRSYTKDVQFSVNLAYEKGVVTIPLSVFYTPENKMIGENYVRLAYCKRPETIESAFKNLKI